jgi:voltage-gated potassium channel
MIIFNKQNNYSYVLLFLILTLCTIPFRYLGWTGMGFTLSFLHTALLISAVYSCAHKKRIRYLVGIMAFFSILATWMGSLKLFMSIEFRLTSGILFYVIFSYVILEDIFKTKKANRNILSASLSAYILIGFTFAFIYTLLEVKLPGSFVIPEPAAPEIEHVASQDEDSLTGTFFYHSFVTLTTLGYGDIQPRSQAARFFCIIQAIIGQFYLVVVVAGIVGLTATNHFSGNNGAQE